MNNSSITVGQSYADRMSYGMEEVFRAEAQGLEGCPDEPLKFKIYRGASRIPLLPDIPLTLGDTFEIFERRRTGQFTIGEPKPLALRELSYFLYYNLGVTRLERLHPYPFHRPVASARCFYPVELYVQIRGNMDATQGLHHYNAAHHILETVRGGDWLNYVNQAVASPMDQYDFIVIVSVLFWKNAFKYRNFSYRLCAQEAGMVVENLLLTGRAMGLSAKVYYQFLDQAVNSLLGLEAQEESVFAIIGFSAGATGVVKKKAASPAPEVGEPPARLESSYLKRSRLDLNLCSMLNLINETSYLVSLQDEISLPLLPPERPPASSFEGAVSLPEGPRIKGTDLAEVLRERHSGASWLSPEPRAIPLEALSECLRHLLIGYDNDLRDHDAAIMSCIDCYVVANRIESLSPGVYRYCPETHRMLVVRRQDCREELRRMSTQPNLNLYTIPAVFFLVGDYPSALHQLGNRGYRILNMQAGLIAQRISLLAAASGFFARCSDSFRVAEAEALLGISESSATPLFQVILGIGELKPRYRFSLIF